MAEDVDASIFGLIPGFGAVRPMLEVANKGLIAAQAPALFVEHESMVKYKQRVDALLEQLKDSKADSGKIADGTLGKGDLGKGFAEADNLYAAYNKVRSELENLSKGLANQIEALGIAIMASRVGYENIDDEVKMRMRAIHADAQKHYDPKRDPQHKENAAQQPQAQGQGNGSTAGGEM
ncbi:hypothetical protein [Streptomyces bambusae]|uniref:Uncharacterized protein n=1 Tax=Streptomyces bambusae TaxID=1550616 RepID=A0ABS6ZEU0_9ACTN|nr:hypothetical protein [Streptomyces bambusae]MBW5486283.1 hypothetical protein [Streptomyces bambusae]